MRGAAGLFAGAALLLAAPAAAQDEEPLEGDLAVDSDQPLDSELPRPIPNYHILTDTPRKGTSAQNFRIALTITGEGSTLWAGDLVLAEYNGARIESDIQDTDPACPPDSREVATRRSAIIAEVVPIDLAEGYEFKVYALWSRRHPGCAAPGQRVSRIDVRFPIAVGETRVIEGDGGLRIALTRRT